MKFPGYKKLLGPEQLGFDPWTRVETPEDYLRWHDWVVRRRHGQPWDSPEPIHAEVWGGRWVASCFWCKTVLLTRPQWGMAYCAECGARYREGMVIFPDKHEEIERILCQRIIRETQGWLRGETVADLVSENIAHGVV